MSRTWTDEEIDYLEDKWGNISVPTIAKNLGRTVGAIKSKAYKIGLGRFIHQGNYVTYRQLITSVGYRGADSFLKKRLKEKGFPIKYKKSENKKIAIVYLEDFWDWVEKNKKEISFANFDKGDLGKEPEWVDEKRKNDSKNPTKATPKKQWTKEEDNILISKLKLNKYTYGDLSKDFNRTESAIRRRIYDLKLNVRPVSRCNRTKWTKDEEHRMIELHNEGYDSYTIARELNKPELGVSDKISRMFSRGLG